MHFRLADYGEIFSTRTRGREVREDLERSLQANESVVVDFDCVAKVSQSFSDEFLGALIAATEPDRVVVEGMTPAVERVISRALRRRGFHSVLDRRLAAA
jgi:hypothetical protein